MLKGIRKNYKDAFAIPIEDTDTEKLLRFMPLSSTILSKMSTYSVVLVKKTELSTNPGPRKFNNQDAQLLEVS